MHQYQIDSNVKTNFVIVATLLSVALAYCFNLGIQYFNIQIPWYFETPSILGVFGLIYWLYDKFLWKTQLVQKIEWIRIPNISGNWNVEITSSFDEFREKVDGKAVIRQTAFKISVATETKNSRSNSIQASLMRSEKIHEYELIYNYVNHPHVDSTQTMEIHKGTTIVSISDNGTTMEGEYYSGRGRRNFGRIGFTR